MFTYQHPHPAVASDIVVLGISEEKLKVLLIRRGLEPFAGKWALPGGFLRPDETVEECARRELFEETGVRDVLAIIQVGIFSRPDRDPRERVISVPYVACIELDSAKLSAGTDAAEAAWFDAKDPPPLAFDHAEILKASLKAAKNAAPHHPLVPRMLKSPFSLTQLQSATELVMGKSLDKRNFRRQVLEADWLKETGAQIRGTHRPAQLYELKTHHRDDDAKTP